MPRPGIKEPKYQYRGNMLIMPKTDSKDAENNRKNLFWRGLVLNPTGSGTWFFKACVEGLTFEILVEEFTENQKRSPSAMVYIELCTTIESTVVKDIRRIVAHGLDGISALDKITLPMTLKYLEEGIALRILSCDNIYNFLARYADPRTRLQLLGEQRVSTSSPTDGNH